MPKTEDYPSVGRKTAQSENRSVSGEAAKAVELEGSQKPSSPFAAIRRIRFSSVPLVELKHGDVEEITFPASVELPRRHVTFYSDVDSDSSLSGGGLCSMSDTVESFKDIGGNPCVQSGVRIKHLTKNADGSSRFPKLDECAHFHYDNVELGPINVTLLSDRHESDNTSEWWFAIQVTSEERSWRLRRSYENFQMLDRQLHRCVYDRKFSLLNEISATDQTEDALRAMLTEYLERFSQLAGSLINCGPVLNWLELDNRGNRLIVTDEAAINTPAIAAAYVTKRYASQATDEISLEVGDIISVIDMPPPAESTWWRGKKGFQVGFFPCECVEIIGDKVPQSIKIPKVSTKPVLRKHGKLIAFFRSFLLSRPSRRKLKQSGILKERVFGCDLGEHLMNSGRDIPLVLKYCTEFIEQHGIVDGIYRLSGVTSNIQKLRLAFDEDKVPNLMDEAILQDIHCVASLLKMYFRELPNPLLTFHLYDKFVSAVQAEESMRLLKLRDVVQQLPPPHYRSLEYLMRHLSKVAAYGSQTGMTPKNVAIVWAPNLLRDIENGGGAGALHVVGVQAVLTEYLIRYTDIIFSEKMPIFPTPITCEETPKKTRPKSLAISTPTKLLSLEEARSRALTSNLPGDHQKFIDVGGGEENLPVKYHTVIDLPVRHRSSGKSKKSPSGWRSFFSRGWHTASERRKNRRLRSKEGGTRPKISSPMFLQHSPLNFQDKAVTESDVVHSNTKKLRTVKSAENLFPPSGLSSSLLADQKSPFTSIDESTASSQPTSSDIYPLQDAFSSSNSLSKSSNCQKHIRSTSHDSYFERIAEVPTDDESEMDDLASDVILMKTSVRSDDTDTGSRKIEMTQSFQGLCDSPKKRNKIAQKQKLVSFDSEASSPKLQKLSLKRASTSSPPIIKRKDNVSLGSSSCQESINSQSGYSTTAIASFTSAETTDLNREVNCRNEQHENTNFSFTPVPFSADSLMETDEKKDTTCAEIHATMPSSNFDLNPQKSEENGYQASVCDESDTVMSFSMEATISESVSLSQLLSFDSKDCDANVSSDNESRSKNIDCSLIPQDGSLTTPESPTGDNLSEIPSSAGSEVSGSTSDIYKQTSASESFDGVDGTRKMLDTVDETVQGDLETICGEADSKALNKEVEDQREIKDQPNGRVGVEDQLADQTKLLHITSTNSDDSFKNFTAILISPEQRSDDNIEDNKLQLNHGYVETILSPPENFVGDRGKLHKTVAVKNEGTNGHQNAMIPENSNVCMKSISNITVSGSLGNDLFRSNNEFFDSLTSQNKKRSCSEKLSPISPVEESKRRFESEIGRLIVRDRQMKLEMEQMKVERQKYKQRVEISAIPDSSKRRNERKFADAIDFCKSPIKSFEINKKKQECMSDDVMKSFKETTDKSPDFVSNHGYSRYVRMENKPSVKELLSKFEGQKQHNDFAEFSKVTNSFSLPKHSTNVFCNLQVFNHSGPVTSCKNTSLEHNQSSKTNQSTHREHIFQTECVVRFPHPKSSSEDSTQLKSRSAHSNCGYVDMQPLFNQGDKKLNGLHLEAGNSRTSPIVLDTSLSLPKSSVLHQVGDPLEHRGRSPHKHKVDSELINGKKSGASPSDESHQSLSVDSESPFSTFRDSFKRANRITLQRRKEFLQELESPRQSTDAFNSSQFHTYSSFRSPTNQQEGSKRHANVRQRPKSVPPSVCRLSFSPTNQISSAQTLRPGQTSSAYCEVPKTNDNGVININQSPETSQQRNPPKLIRDRAAIFERSLSFSSYMEKNSTLSCSRKCTAQTDSSSEDNKFV